MYTEYIYVNKQYEMIDRNIKALLFDVVTKEQRELLSLKEKAITSSELSDQILKLCDDRDNCLKSLLALADNLSSTLQSLDSCTRDVNYLENKNLAMLVANVHENNVDADEKDEQFEETADTYQQEEASENTEENSEEEAINEDQNVGSESEEVQNTEENSEEEAINEDQNVGSESEEVQNTEEKQDETTPVVDISTIYGNSESEEQTASESQENDLPVGETTQEEKDANSEQQIEQVNDVVAEQTSAETPIVQIPMVSESASVIPNADEQVEAPVIQMMPVASEEQPVLEQPVIQSTDVTTPIMTVSPDENVSNNDENSSYTVVYTKNDMNPPKAILTTGKQVTKLRESKDTQSSFLAALGFFSKSSDIQAATVTEQQLIDNGLLPPTAENSQQQIEEMMNRANELYKSGNIEESQMLYNQISQLNNSLKQKVA